MSASRATSGIPDIYGSSLSARHDHRRCAQRTAGTSQHSRRDFPRGTHIPGGSGQIHSGKHSRHTSPAASAGCACLKRNRRRRDTQNHAGANGRASRRPRLRHLPQGDGTRLGSALENCRCRRCFLAHPGTRRRDFDVSLNSATGLPFWTAKSHVDLTGEAKKIHGRWYFTHVSSAAVGVPIP